MTELKKNNKLLEIKQIKSDRSQLTIAKSDFRDCVNRLRVKDVAVRNEVLEFLTTKLPFFGESAYNSFVEEGLFPALADILTSFAENRPGSETLTQKNIQDTILVVVILFTSEQCMQIALYEQPTSPSSILYAVNNFLMRIPLKQIKEEYLRPYIRVATYLTNLSSISVNTNVLQQIDNARSQRAVLFVNKMVNFNPFPPLFRFIQYVLNFDSEVDDNLCTLSLNVFFSFAFTAYTLNNFFSTTQFCNALFIGAHPCYKPITETLLSFQGQQINGIELMEILFSIAKQDALNPASQNQNKSLTYSPSLRVLTRSQTRNNLDAQKDGHKIKYGLGNSLTTRFGLILLCLQRGITLPVNKYTEVVEWIADASFSKTYFDERVFSGLLSVAINPENHELLNKLNVLPRVAQLVQANPFPENIVAYDCSLLSAYLFLFTLYKSGAKKTRRQIENAVSFQDAMKFAERGQHLKLDPPSAPGTKTPQEMDAEELQRKKQEGPQAAERFVRLVTQVRNEARTVDREDSSDESEEGEDGDDGKRRTLEAQAVEEATKRMEQDRLLKAEEDARQEKAMEAERLKAEEEARELEGKATGKKKKKKKKGGAAEDEEAPEEPPADDDVPKKKKKKKKAAAAEDEEAPEEPPADDDVPKKKKKKKKAAAAEDEEAAEEPPADDETPKKKKKKKKAAAADDEAPPEEPPEDEAPKKKKKKKKAAAEDEAPDEPAEEDAPKKKKKKKKAAEE